MGQRVPAFTLLYGIGEELAPPQCLFVTCRYILSQNNVCVCVCVRSVLTTTGASAICHTVAHLGALCPTTSNVCGLCATTGNGCGIGTPCMLVNFARAQHLQADHVPPKGMQAAFAPPRGHEGALSPTTGHARGLYSTTGYASGTCPATSTAGTPCPNDPKVFGQMLLNQKLCRACR